MAQAIHLQILIFTGKHIKGGDDSLYDMYVQGARIYDDFSIDAEKSSEFLPSFAFRHFNALFKRARCP